MIDEAVARAAQAVLVWATRGVGACMNEYNAGRGDGDADSDIRSGRRW